MQTGFSFKGRHCSEFGIYASTQSRPILPEAKRATFDPDGGDGYIDYSTANTFNRYLYNERLFRVAMGIKADNIYKLQNKLSTIAPWLTGTGELRFDDMPGIVWDAAVISEIEYAPELKGRKAVLTVNFYVKPFSKADCEAEEGSIPIGSDLPIGSLIPLDCGDVGVAVTSAAPAVLNVYNIGTAPAKPIFTIETSAARSTAKITIEKGGAEFKYTHSGKLCIVDMTKGTASTDLKVVDTDSNITEDGVPTITKANLFELDPGENMITISVASALSGEYLIVKVKYTPLFWYGPEVGA